MANLLVVLSLTVDGPSSAHVEILERRIILYPGHLDISIGRASKVSRKGFTAANDNGWFDSPVMSRLHARLSATMEEKVRRPGLARGFPPQYIANYLLEDPDQGPRFPSWNLCQ